MKALYKWLIILNVIVISTRAYAYDEERVVKRQFNVTPKTLIDVNNKYGKVHVNTWNKNEVEVEITIVAKGRDGKRMDEILESIEIKFDEQIDEDYLGVHTRIGNTGKNASFSINYMVHMPLNNRLKLTNSFGDVYVSDLNAESELNVKYGLLKVESLQKHAEINLSFGNAMSDINALTSADINIMYSKLHIDRATQLNINSQFSDLEFSEVENIALQMKYGKLLADKVNSITGAQQFSELRIEQLESQLDIQMKYNKVYIDKISNSMELFDVKAEYSNMEVGLESGMKAVFELSFSYCDLKYQGGEIDFYYVNKDAHKKEYKGYMVDKNAASKFKVVSKYGDLRLEVE